MKQNEINNPKEACEIKDSLTQERSMNSILAKLKKIKKIRGRFFDL